MPDFDANDDSTRLPGTGQGKSSDRAAFQPPPSRRGRDLARRHPAASRRVPAGRSGAFSLVSRRRANRVACRPAALAAGVLTPSRRQLRLWNLCRGTLPGSLS